MFQLRALVVTDCRCNHELHSRRDRRNPAGVWCVSYLAVAVLALAPATLDAACQELHDPSRLDQSNPPLPPRALLRIGTNDLRTSGSIRAFAFSPDGRFIAAPDLLANDSRVVIWDVQSGRKVKQIVAPGKVQQYIESLAFSPDGTKLLWGEHGGDVVLWDLPGNRLLKRDKPNEEGTSAVAFSPDGSLMAIAGAQVIQLRKVASPGEVVRELDTQPDRAPGMPRPPVLPGRQGLGSLAFTPDGTRLVAGALSNAIIFIWCIDDGRLLRRIPDAHGILEGGLRTGGLNCVAVTPDGRRIMSAGETGEVRQVPNVKYGAKMPMSQVRLWDIETGELIADYHGEHDYGSAHGALSPDGRRIAVADFSRLRILDAATGAAEQTFELPGSWGEQPAFSPDGKLVAMPIDNAMALFEVATGRRLHHDASTPVGYPARAGWSPSGDRIVTGHDDGFVRVWDAATGKLIWHKLLAAVIGRGGWNAHPAFVSFSRDGELVVAAGHRYDPVNRDDGIVTIYEAASGRVVRELAQKKIHGAALAPDRRMLVVATSYGGTQDTHFVGIEVGTGQIRWANPAQDQRVAFDQVATMRFAGDSPWFEAALRDGSVIRFNSLTGHEQRRFVAEWRTPEQQKADGPHPPGFWSATFSADGRTLVSLQKEWLYVWNVESGTLRRKLRRPRQQMCSLTLSSEGRTLATSEWYSSEDKGEDTIRLFDTEKGEQILTLEPGSRASVMEFSPDGTRLYTGLHQSCGVVWDVRGAGATAKE